MKTPGEGITGGQGAGRMVRQMFQVIDRMEGKKERKDLEWMGCCPTGEELWSRRCFHIAKSRGPFSARPAAPVAASDTSDRRASS